MNKKRMLALPLIAIMLSLTTAVAVAHWVDNLYVVGNVESGNLAACIYLGGSTITGDDWTSEPGLKNVRQLTKDIANVTVNWTCETLYVTVNNGYPCYYDHISFNVENTGTVPWSIYMVRFWSNYGDPVVMYENSYFTLDLTGDQVPDIELRYGDNFGDQIDPGEMADLSFEFHLLNPIPQGAQCLQFYAQIYMVNWNEYLTMLPPGQNPQ
jgi:hypothetical protein